MANFTIISTWFGARRRKKPVKNGLNGSQIGKLADELILKIFGYLNEPELVSTGNVCQDFRRIIEDRTLWAERVTSRFPNHERPVQVPHFHYYQCLSSTLKHTLVSSHIPNANDRNRIWDYCLHRNMDALDAIEDKTSAANWFAWRKCFKALDYLFKYDEIQKHCAESSHIFYYVAKYGTEKLVSKYLKLTNIEQALSQNHQLYYALASDGNHKRLKVLFTYPAFKSIAIKFAQSAMLSAINNKQTQTAKWLLYHVPRNSISLNDTTLIEACLAQNQKQILSLLFNRYKNQFDLASLFPVQLLLQNFHQYWKRRSVQQLNVVGESISLNDAQSYLYEKLDPNHNLPLLKVLIKFDLKGLSHPPKNQPLDVFCHLELNSMPPQLIAALFNIEEISVPNRKRLRLKAAIKTIMHKGRNDDQLGRTPPRRLQI